MNDNFLAVQKDYWNRMATHIGDDIAANHWVDDNDQPLNATLFDEIANYLIDKFLNGLAAGSVLEIGCGNGLILKQLRAKLTNGWRLYGCDISDKMLKRSALKDITLLCADARNIPSADSQYDLIYLHSVTQYFDNEMYLRDVITECRRLLRPAGTLCIMDVPVTWYMDSMIKGDVKTMLRRALSGYIRTHYSSLWGMMKRMRGKVGRKMEVVNGISVPFPEFSGYYVNPDVFEEYKCFFNSVSCEVQPFKFKPINYKKYRFNFILKGKK